MSRPRFCEFTGLSRPEWFVALMIAPCLFAAGIIGTKAYLDASKRRVYIASDRTTHKASVQRLLEDADRRIKAFEFDVAIRLLDEAAIAINRSTFDASDQRFALENLRRVLVHNRLDYESKMRRGYKLIGGELLSVDERAARKREQQAAAEKEQRDRTEWLADKRRRSEAAAVREAVERDPARMRDSWATYMAVCGMDALRGNQLRAEKFFREHYLGQTIYWCGVVHRVRTQPGGTEIWVELKMTPTESVGSDVTLVMAAEWQPVALALSPGDPIEFRGVIRGMSDGLANHAVEMQFIRRP